MVVETATGLQVWCDSCRRKISHIYIGEAAPTKLREQAHRRVEEIKQEHSCHSWQR